jgi:ADP-heptose:LPS heptosyltransferase
LKVWLRENVDVVVETNDRFNWSCYNNLGVRASRGEFLLFLNDDIEVMDSSWLPALLEHAQNREVGVVGPHLLYPDGRVQHAGMFLASNVGRHAFRFAPADDPGPFGLALATRNVIAVTGACMLVRRDVYESLGGFDEAHSVINNDLDFCLRASSAGLRVVFTPYAKLIHHEMASRAAIGDVHDAVRFQGAWGLRFLKGDPYYNHALDGDVDDYAPQLEPIELLHVGRPLVAREDVRAILAVKLDHIGDFVIAFPALRRLKRQFPKARLCVLGAKASGMLAKLEPAIDEFIEWNFFHARSGITGTLVNEAGLQALETRLRPYRFNIAIDLRMQGETRHVLRHCGALVLAGFEHQGRFPWLDVVVEWEGDRSLTPKRLHAGDHLLQLVDALAASCEREPLPVIQPSDLAEAQARLRSLIAAASPDLDLSAGFLDRPLICIHTGAGSDMKQWPAGSFAALIDLLVAEYGAGIILIGVSDEVGVAEEVKARVTRREAVISLVGKVELGDLPFLFRACRLFVGNDSGPKHLAASLGVPTLGIHSSNVDPREWAPAGRYALAIRRKVTCGPCYVAIPSDCHRNLFCLRSIRPGDVFRACETLLGLFPAHKEAKTAELAESLPGAVTGRRQSRRSKSRSQGVQRIP